jgi:membrane protein
MTPDRPTSVEAPGTSGGRLSLLVDWLRGRTETSLGRLALLWFRRYFEASRNSGAAAAAYITLSVLPAALVIIGIFNLARGDESAFADRVVRHMKLDGATADIVRDLFGTTADNVTVASVAVAIGFLIWGISIGGLYQDVYARAWGIRVGSAADQLRYTIWFFLLSGILAVMLGSASELRASGWLIALPLWVGGSILFWLWTPRYLLHRKISLRSLLPGALLATFVLSGTIATSPLWIGPTINQNASAFGAFGAVIALFAYILIGTTLSMVCAVFAPVWAEWRLGEQARKK